MSAFRVFGVSFKQIYDRLYRTGTKEKSESIAQYDQRILQKALEEFATSMQLKPVSGLFDAPQFAQEFIADAHPEYFRHLTIRVNAMTGDVNKKNEPKRKWVKYEEGKKYIVSLGEARSLA